MYCQTEPLREFFPDTNSMIGVMETSPTYRLAGADGPRGVRQNGKPLCQPSVGAATSGFPTPGTLQTMEKLSLVTPLSQQVCFLGPYCGVLKIGRYVLIALH